MTTEQAFALGAACVAASFYYGYRRQHLARQEAERIRKDSAEIDNKIQTIGIVLPPPKPPGGNYIPVKVIDLDAARQEGRIDPNN